jgi:F-type H+-transporting ATPase subunit epsilon
MANTILLEVVTPERLVFSENVEFFSLRGQGGELGILPGHIPLCTGVNPCLLHFRNGEKKGILTVLGGFLNVQPDKATVLADAAERAEDIDAARAKLAKQRAEEQASHHNDNASQAALERAVIRLQALDVQGARAGR